MKIIEEKKEVKVDENLCLKQRATGFVYELSFFFFLTANWQSHGQRWAISMGQPH